MYFHDSIFAFTVSRVCSILKPQGLLLIVALQPLIQFGTCSEPSPSAASNSAASPEIPCILWNLEVHCRIHTSMSFVPAVSQMRPVRDFPSYIYLKGHSIMTASSPSTPRSSVVLEQVLLKDGRTDGRTMFVIKRIGASRSR